MKWLYSVNLEDPVEMTDAPLTWDNLQAAMAWIVTKPQGTLLIPNALLITIEYRGQVQESKVSDLVITTRFAYRDTAGNRRHDAVVRDQDGKFVDGVQRIAEGGKSLQWTSGFGHAGYAQLAP